MCGIVGLWRCSEAGTLGPMLDVITHRGPDDSGEFSHADSAIGARRLSIIDVDGGHQPAFSQDGSIALVLNGEIYNHRELRTDLERAGRMFHSSCDTEVLAQGMAAWGVDDLLRRTRGMFAFAALDRTTGTMTIARDRLGIKPLYWAQLGRGYAFASEAKSLFAHPDISPRVNQAKIPEQIACRFVSGPDTVFEGIHRVAPGSYWTLDETTGVSQHTYWTIPEPEATRPTLEEVVARTTDMLRDSVVDRLVSDVPVGALLSGGLDSSIVVAQMSELAEKPPLTFTVGFGDRELDERPYARVVAREFGTDHHEEVVELSSAESLAETVWYFDEPVGDAAALPTLLIARAAARHVKVVLTGEGSDELFGGYPRYRLSALADSMYRLPPWTWKPLLYPGTVFPGRIGHVARRLLQSHADVELRNSVWMSNLDRQHLSELCPGADTGNWAEAYGHGSAAAPWRIDMDRWLLNDILLKVDKMSMGASIEARVPFLDHRLVEYVSRLPTDLRTEWLGKRVLKQAFSNRLPQTSLQRAKAPFKPPLAAWFRAEAGKHLIALINEKGSFASEFLRKDGVKRLHTRHSNGADHGLVLWQLYTLEIWWRRFFKKTSSL